MQDLALLYHRYWLVGVRKRYTKDLDLDKASIESPRPELSWMQQPPAVTCIARNQGRRAILVA